MVPSASRALPRRDRDDDENPRCSTAAASTSVTNQVPSSAAVQLLTRYAEQKIPGPLVADFCRGPLLNFPAPQLQKALSSLDLVVVKGDPGTGVSHLLEHCCDNSSDDFPGALGCLFLKLDLAAIILQEKCFPTTGKKLDVVDQALNNLLLGAMSRRPVGEGGEDRDPVTIPSGETPLTTNLEVEDRVSGDDIVFFLKRKYGTERKQAAVTKSAIVVVIAVDNLRALAEEDATRFTRILCKMVEDTVGSASLKLKVAVEHSDHVQEDLRTFAVVSPSKLPKLEVLREEMQKICESTEYDNADTVLSLIPLCCGHMRSLQALAWLRFSFMATDLSNETLTLLVKISFPSALDSGLDGYQPEWLQEVLTGQLHGNDAAVSVAVCQLAAHRLAIRDPNAQWMTPPLLLFHRKLASFAPELGMLFSDLGGFSYNLRNPWAKLCRILHKLKVRLKVREVLLDGKERSEWVHQHVEAFILDDTSLSSSDRCDAYYYQRPRPHPNCVESVCWLAPCPENEDDKQSHQSTSPARSMLCVSGSTASTPCTESLLSVLSTAAATLKRQDDNVLVVVWNLNGKVGEESFARAENTTASRPLLVVDDSNLERHVTKTLAPWFKLTFAKEPRNATPSLIEDFDY